MHAPPPRVLSRDEAHALGYGEAALRHLVASGRWQRILPRTYLTSDTLLWPDKLAAAVAFAGAGGLLSGPAALGGLGLTAATHPARILVVVPANRAPRSTSWVQVRPSARPVARALLPGPPRVSVARAVTDAALGRRHLDDVRALVAEAVHKRLCTVEELVAELAHCPRQGSGHLRQAMEEVAGGAWSAPEARAATALRRGGAPPFEQNARIDLPDGRYVYADFLWRELRAVLEIDSDAHHALAGAADRTSDRHLVLSTLDYSVIHRTPRFVVRQESEFVAGVLDWLAARAAALGLRPAG